MSAPILLKTKSLTKLPPNLQLLEEKEPDSDSPLHMQSVPWT